MLCAQVELPTTDLSLRTDCVEESSLAIQFGIGFFTGEFITNPFGEELDEFDFSTAKGAGAGFWSGKVDRAVEPVLHVKWCSDVRLETKVNVSRVMTRLAFADVMVRNGITAPHGL